MELLDSHNNPVRVTARGMFTAEPVRLDGAGSRYRGELVGGPGRGRWTNAGGIRGDGTGQVRPGRSARAQVLVADTALLLCYRQRRWYLEGVYGERTAGRRARPGR